MSGSANREAVAIILRAIAQVLNPVREKMEPARWWWLGQRDPIARFTLWLVISTTLLFTATGISAVVLLVTDHTLKKTMIASNRAWVVPTSMTLLADIKTGQETNIAFVFGNAGHEPAVKVGRHDDSVVISGDFLLKSRPDNVNQNLSAAIQNTTFPDSCELAKNKRFQGVINPGIGNNLGYVSLPAATMTDAVVNGLDFVVVKGCFVYETMGEAHSTEYCYFYSKKMASMSLESTRTTMKFCYAYNDAN
jgi:hypothetical protein